MEKVIVATAILVSMFAVIKMGHRSYRLALEKEMLAKHVVVTKDFYKGATLVLESTQDAVSDKERRVNFVTGIDLLSKDRKKSESGLGLKDLVTLKS